MNALVIGQTIDGRYQITRLLGEGGMGAVYEAIHAGTGRRVAVKVIVSDDLAKNYEVVGRFQREAKAAGSIDTQHIVQVLDTGMDQSTGLPFMVMEFLAGEDIQQQVQRLGPMPPELALRVVAQACIGLQKAHEAGVVHRDIKPANLYLARRDEGKIIVKLLDFGIAKVKMDQALAEQNQGLTRTGSMLGSPLYMSPEQAKGLKSIDHRTDIWSLGAVLYECLSATTPHGHLDTLGQLILAICSEPPPSIQDRAPWVSPEIAAIVHGALTLDVSERFQTSQAMLDAIRPLLPNGHELDESMFAPLSPEYRAYVAPRLALSVGGAHLKTTGVSATTSHGGTTHGLASTLNPKPSRAAPILLGMGAVGVAAGVAFFALRPKPVPPPPLPVAALPAPTPTPTPTPVAPPSAAAPALKTVRLTISPPSATVTIDGADAKVTDGTAEVTGTLGSVHRVEVSLNGRTTEGEVVVTEAGAIPAKITVGVAVPKPAKPVASAGPAGPAPTGGKPASAPTAKPKPPTQLDTKFE